MSGPSLDLNRLEPLGASIADEVGRMFRHGDRLLRAIYASEVQAVRELLASGLVEDLVAEGLFPRTTVTELSSERFPLVLEHEVFGYVTYPFEWSFGMLRDAALLVLKINMRANAYGYELKDGHAMNVVFTPRGPAFVDLGSFVKIADPACGWIAEADFVHHCLHPLRMWAEGREPIARKLLVGAFAKDMPLALVRDRHPLTRALPLRVVEDMLEALRLYRALRVASHEQIRARLPFPFGPMLCALKRAGMLPGGRASHEGLARRVRRLAAPTPSPARAARQDRGRPPEAGPRRDARVLELAATLAPASVLDLACGDGERARALSKLPGVRTVIGNNPDAHAIDRCRERQAQSGDTLLTSVVDVIRPAQYFGFALPHERLAADLVIALDLTRYWLFTRTLYIDVLLEAIGAYARGYVLIEFVPLSAEDPPEAAAWYNAEWFEAQFRVCFELTHVEPFNDGRVLFVGRKRHPS